jgi:uncharacterized protein (DUF488 family)
MIKLYTIGFTKKSAEHFFELLKKNNVKKIVDIRINNTSQLAGFAKGSDLAYFAKSINNIEYVYIPDFAPTKELLSDYQNKKIGWLDYQKIFMNLIEQRKISSKYDIADFNGSCFLCSEDTPEKCHRRLVVEYFKRTNNDIQIIHLK